MPQQLIYTSSPRGLVVGRSGYCVVACSEGMREALQSRLEQISYFEHGMLAGVQHPEVCVYRILDIRGTRFHCLSRIVDAGLDFTKRTNFTAHHLVFTPAEITSLPPPPVIFLKWNGWRNNWAGDPEWLTHENWGNLFSLANPNLIPCRQWQNLTGDAANAAVWFENRPETFIADGYDHTLTLGLMAESLALQAARPGGGSPWQLPFTTFLQEGDDPAEFFCRLVYTGTSAHARLAGRGTLLVPLRNARVKSVNESTAACARSGLIIVRQPEDREAIQNERLLLRVEARASVAPTYQWYLCSAEGKSLQEITGATEPELKYDKLKVGYNYFCVVVRCAGGSVSSRVVKIGARSATSRATPTASTLAKEVPVKPAGAALPVIHKKERVWKDTNITLDEDETTTVNEKSGDGLKWVAIISLVFVLIIGVGILIVKELTKGSESAEITNSAPGDDIAPNKSSNSSGVSAPPVQDKPTPITTKETIPNSPESHSNVVAPPKSLIAFVYVPNICDSDNLSKASTYLANNINSKNIKQGRLQELKKTVADNIQKYQNDKDALASDTNERNNLEKKKQNKKLDQKIADDQKKVDEDGWDQKVKDISEFEADIQKLDVQIKAGEDLKNKLEATKYQISKSITDRFAKLFDFQPNGKIHYEAKDLIWTNKASIAGDLGPDKWDINIDDSRFRLSVATNGAFTVTGFEAIKNRLTNSVEITFYTNSAPLGPSIAKLILWPTYLPSAATIGTNGAIHLGMNQGISEVLNELNEKGDYDVTLTFSYGACQTNYTRFSQDYTFSELGFKRELWIRQLSTLEVLNNIEGYAKGINNNTIPTSTGIWDEIDKVCQIRIHPTEKYDSLRYFFADNPDAGKTSFLKEIDNANMPDDEKAKLESDINNADFSGLGQFIHEEHIDSNNLKIASEKLAGHVDKRGNFVPTKMVGKILIKNIPLVYFVFSLK